MSKRDWAAIVNNPNTPEADRFEAGLRLVLENHEKVEIDLQSVEFSLAAIDTAFSRLSAAGYTIVGTGGTRTVLRL